jgi:endogenous inhibitor of DNA gyrase (YacG/DUF329 family)
MLPLETWRDGPIGEGLPHQKLFRSDGQSHATRSGTAPVACTRCKRIDDESVRNVACNAPQIGVRPFCSSACFVGASAGHKLNVIFAKRTLLLKARAGRELGGFGPMVP